MDHRRDPSCDIVAGHEDSCCVLCCLVCCFPLPLRRWLRTTNRDGMWASASGRLNADFRPYYTYYAGGTPDQFENEAHGLQVEFLAGKRHRLSERWSLSVEGSAAFNSFKWSLSIPEEPAELEYSLPYRLALSVVPEVHFGRVSVYAGLGGGVGRVHELKTTPDAQVSRYDYDEDPADVERRWRRQDQDAGGFDLFAHVGNTWFWRRVRHHPVR